MKTTKKQTVISIALILILAASTLMAFAPTANAVVTEIDTYAHVLISPNPAGVGQNVLITARIDKLAAGALIRSGHFNGTTVKITRPDGTTETKGPYEMDSTSSAWFLYVPTQAGKYQFQTVFPAQWINGSGLERLYKASVSPAAEGELTVQQAPIESIPNNPLPTGYWTRPIYSENKGWNTIADNWLMSGYDYPAKTFTISCAFSPYTSAPEAAHVLWKKQIMYGGEVGGMFGDKSFYTGLSYEQFYNPYIVSGRVIYTEHGPTSATVTGTRCVSLYTGEDIWYMNNTNIAFAQTVDIETPNEHGVLPYLWETTGSGTNNTWRMYDAFDGRLVTTVTNITAGAASRRGTYAFGPSGEILAYYLDGTRNWLSMWNSSKAIGGANVFDTWSPNFGSIIDGSRGIEWNVTVPDLPGTPSISQVNGGYVLVSNVSGISSVVDPFYHAVFPGTLSRDGLGRYPTSINYMWLADRVGVQMGSYKFSNIQDGAYVMYDEGRLQFHCYDILTGAERWVSQPLIGWAIFTYSFYIAYNKLYSAGFDGHTRAFNLADGKLLWDYYFGSSGYENAYGTWPNYAGFIVADGKIYVTNDEHSPDSVMWRGGKLWCIDAETGRGLWNISGWLRHGAVSDGILTALNSLDGIVYTFGKGTSDTTVSAPQTVVPVGTGVMITGTVTDQSPAQKGTPAIADESMAAWMEYLHMQKPIPGDAKGVPVVLTAIDPNGNTQNIGTVTSDMSGMFKKMWTPPVPGEYTIIASFEGTNSYGPSFAETALGVSAAPAPSATPPPSPPTSPPQTLQPSTPPPTSPPVSASPIAPPPVSPPAEVPDTAVYIAVAAVVVVVAVVAAAVILRRRK
ncbi:MAG: PQQ-binding-like beta-propeller repeat protein [Candidatus Bathyarchaeia archaeon]